MPVSAKIAPHGQLANQEAILREVDTIPLNEASDVSLNLHPRDIEMMTRQGDNLLVTLENGELIRVENFYADPTELSHLYLQGDEFAGELFQVGLGEAGAGGTVPFTSTATLTTAETALTTAAAGAGTAGVETATGAGAGAGAGISTAGLVAGGVAVAAGVGVAAATGDDSSSSDEDTTAPEAPVLDETNGSILTGSSEPGATIEVTNATGDSVGSAVADADGNFSVELSPKQAAGTELTATATDDAGNVSEASTAVTVPQDADVAAPNTPTIAAATDDVEAITGALEEGDSTNDATPTLTGSAEIGSTVTVTHNGEVIGTTIADSNGTWSFTPDTEFADGEHVFSVTATDEAGNVSVPSGEFTLTVDTTAPDAPILSETDGETANGSTVNGSAEAGGTVEITNGDGDLLGTGTVADDGTFSITLSPKQEAGAELTATLTDAAGNVSPASDALVVPEDADVTPPNTPTITSAIDDVETVTGTLASGDSTNDATPTLTGSAEIGSTVTVTHNGEVIGTTTADSNGAWSFTPNTELGDGEHVFSVTATDAAGNESAASAEFTLSIDTVAPDAPILSETDGETANGSAEAGGTVEITNGDGDLLGTGTVANDGSFSITLSPKQDAGTELTATVTDAAGNESAASDTLVVPEDADITAPNVPTIASATDDVEAVTGTLASGDSTNDATPILTGSAEVDSSVTITLDGDIVATIVADANGSWSYTPDTELTDGNHVFSVTATDAAGNESTPSGEFTLSIDTVAPDAPILSETDGETANGSTVNGSAEAGGTVEITNGDGDLLGTGTVANDGSFSITLSPKQAAGTELTATVTDAAGNESAASDTLVVPEDADITAPNVPTIASATDDVEAVTGTLASGDSTNDATPILTGSAEVDSSVTITLDGDIVATIVADANGSWSYTPDTELTDGNHVFSVTATDAAGNESTPSGEFTLSIDTVAPDAPILSETDGETANGSTVNGSAEAGGTVEITNGDGDLLGTGTVANDGSFSITLSPKQAAGTELTATVTDAAGNESAASDTLVVPEDADITAPNVPTIASATDDVEAVTGTLASGDSTNDATPTLTGSAEVDSSVTITLDGDIVATIVADANGSWSYTPDTELTDGDHIFSVTATDAAGNESTPSGEFTLTVDTTAPDAPILSETDGETANGSAEADGTVEITNADGDLLGTGTVADDGTFSITLSPKQEAGAVLTATVTDAAGNESPVSDTLVVLEDADITAPNVPTIASATDDVEAVIGTLVSGDSTNDATPTLTGSAEIGSTVTVTHNGEVIGTTIADSNGSWRFTPDTEFADGEHVFSVTATDEAGNVSVPSGEFTLTVDTSAPDAPVLSETDGTTVAGTGEAGTTVEVTNANDDVVGTAVVDAEGNFSVELSPEQEAGSTLTATATDAAGNESAASAALDVPEDADVTPPNTPTITSAIDDVEAVTGTLVSGDSTNDATPTLTGSAEIGSTVTVTHNGEVIGTTIADSNGTWSFTPGTEFADGEHVFSVTATDEAGNVSVPSGEFTLTVDTSAPDAPVLSETDGTTVTGTGEAGTTVEVTNANDDVVGTAVVNAEGNFSVELSPEQEAGSTLTATTTDAAGNESAASAALDVPEDADVTPPNTPTITSAIDDVEAVTGTLASGDSTNDATPTLTGSAEIGSTVTVTHNGEVIGTTIADSNGTWSFTPGTEFADGEHVFSVTATDEAGNVSVHDFITNDDDGLTITATLDAALAEGETLQYSNDGGTTWIDISGSVDGITVSHVDAGLTASATVQLKVQDAAGNDGAVASQAIVIDVTAPTTTATIDAISDDSGIADDFVTNDDDGLTITATLDAALAEGETLQYSNDGGTTWIDISGSVSGTAVSYADADLTASATVQLKVQDAAGNDGAVASQAVVIDAEVPEAPIIVSIIDDVETSTGPLTDGDSTNDTIPLIGGTAEANSTLTLYNGSDVVDIISVDERGNWTFMPDEALVDGDYIFSAVTTDAAGNVSNSSNTFSITVSTIPFVESGNSAVTEDGIGAAPMAAMMFRSFAFAPASDSDSDITSATDSGVLSFGNVSTDTTFTLVKPTAVDIEAEDQLLVWSLSADSKTLQALYTDEETSVESAVITITIDDNGNYTTTIAQGIDHQLDGADSLTFDVGVQLVDGATSLSSTISVKVVDDTPTVKANQFVVVSALNTDYNGSALGDDGGFGADGGYVQQTTIHGVTFTVSDDLSSATVSGSSPLVDIEIGSTVTINDGLLTIETVLGETLSVNVETGAYTYNNSGNSTITDSPNSAPEATISGQGGLLGIVDIEALGLIDLAGTQDLSVSDSDNNITEVVIEKSALLGLNALSPNVTLGYSQELAVELGLIVTPDTMGVEFDLGIGLGFITLIGASTLTITKVGGGVIDQQVLNEFLATVVITSDGAIDVEALGETTLTVMDSGGLSDTADVSGLLGLSVLGGSNSTTATVIEDTEGTGELTAASETGSSRLYGFAGDDEITGSAQADILRGGEGNDILNGGGGSDLIIGGTGDDTLTGGAGVDVFRWEAGDEITSDGSIATDIITDFDTSLPLSEAGGDIIDLSGMLQGEWRLGNAANNLTSFLHITYDAGLDKTIIAISTGGGFSSGYDESQVNHYIDLAGVDLVADSTTDEEIIASLLEQGKLIVDEANSSTVFGDISSDVNFTVIDGDGDTASSKVTFNGQGGTEPDTTTNSAPEVTASSSKLLGLVGLEALGLIDFSQNDVFVTDADGNLASVTITFEPLLSVEVGGTLLTGPEFTANSELAAELGLQFTTTSRAGLLGLVAPEASITITAIDNGDIDNLAINELLSTIALNDGIANVEVLNSITITATDSDGASTTQSLASLADVGVLDGNDDSVFDGDTTGNTIDQSSALIDVQLYGYAGDDTLTGGNGNDLIRGGDGNDIASGGDGNDLLFGGGDDDTLYGGAGSNIFDGGDGDDTIVTSTLTFDVDGGVGIDTLSFDNTGESIDLTALLDADASVNTAANIEVLDISASSETGTSLKIDADTVLNLTDGDNELYIDGDEGDSVEAAGATSSATTTEFNGTTYDTYQLGEATLYIDQDVTVNTSNG
ncbi:Ig-like domain-containing protein [Cobetia sp. Ld8]|uniref:Ig-like domain-containing protein n=1 Tax=Cobetia sp. Ld8 TaxID=649154 RepID=UPI0038676F14